MPDYNEFSVKVMYEALKNDETVTLYMPDYPDGQLPDKEFFHKLIWSLYPHEMYSLIEKSQKLRATDNQEFGDNLIEVDPEIAKEIEQLIQLPSMDFKIMNFVIKPNQERQYTFSKRKPKQFRKESFPVNFQSTSSAFWTPFQMWTIQREGMKQKEKVLKRARTSPRKWGWINLQMKKPEDHISKRRHRAK